MTRKNSHQSIAGLALGMLLTSAALVVAATDSTTQSITMEVEEIAVLTVTTSPATLTIAAPATAGDVPADVSDSTTYAQYTSTVPAGQSRKVTAQLDGSEAAPAGTALHLAATVPDGQGATTGEKQITADSAADIITGIASVNTGSGATDGAQLNYRLTVTDMTSLIADDQEDVTVTLTLTAASGN
jgi:hypothetical protein